MMTPSRPTLAGVFSTLSDPGHHSLTRRVVA